MRENGGKRGRGRVGEREGKRRGRGRRFQSCQATLVGNTRGRAVLCHSRVSISNYQNFTRAMLGLARVWNHHWEGEGEGGRGEEERVRKRRGKGRGGGGREEGMGKGGGRG